MHRGRTVLVSVIPKRPTWVVCRDVVDVGLRSAWRNRREHIILTWRHVQSVSVQIDGIEMVWCIVIGRYGVRIRGQLIIYLNSQPITGSYSQSRTADKTVPGPERAVSASYRGSQGCINVSDIEGRTQTAVCRLQHGGLKKIRPRNSSVRSNDKRIVAVTATGKANCRGSHSSFNKIPSIDFNHLNPPSSHFLCSADFGTRTVFPVPRGMLHVFPKDTRSLSRKGSI